MHPKHGSVKKRNKQKKLIAAVLLGITLKICLEKIKILFCVLFTQSRAWEMITNWTDKQNQ